MALGGRKKVSTLIETKLVETTKSLGLILVVHASGFKHGI